MLSSSCGSHKLPTTAPGIQSSGSGPFLAGYSPASTWGRLLTLRGLTLSKTQTRRVQRPGKKS
eukprot:6217263-Karenia_brevis.AAC.1